MLRIPVYDENGPAKRHDTGCHLRGAVGDAQRRFQRHAVMKQQILIDNERARGYALGIIKAMAITEPMLVIIEPYRDKRSHEQNRRYWAILNDIAEQVIPKESKGYSADTWHKYFAAKYLGITEVKLPNGKALVEPVSTTTLKVDEFNDYMTKIEAFAAERGVILTLET